MSKIQTRVDDAFRSLRDRIVEKNPHVIANESFWEKNGKVWSFLSFLPRKDGVAIDLSVVRSSPPHSWVEADLATESGEVVTEMARVDIVGTDCSANEAGIRTLLNYIESQEPIIVEYILR